MMNGNGVPGRVLRKILCQFVVNRQFTFFFQFQDYSSGKLFGYRAYLKKFLSAESRFIFHIGIPETFVINRFAVHSYICYSIEFSVVFIYTNKGIQRSEERRVGKEWR